MKTDRRAGWFATQLQRTAAYSFSLNFVANCRALMSSCTGTGDAVPSHSQGCEGGWHWCGTSQQGTVSENVAYLGTKGLLQGIKALEQFCRTDATDPGRWKGVSSAGKLASLCLQAYKGGQQWRKCKKGEVSMSSWTMITKTPNSALKIWS